MIQTGADEHPPTESTDCKTSDQATCEGSVQEHTSNIDEKRGELKGDQSVGRMIHSRYAKREFTAGNDGGILAALELYSVHCRGLQKRSA